MKKTYSLLTAVGISLMLSGCATMQKIVDLKPEVDKARAEGPRTRITKFSDSLKNLGKLAETYKDSQFTLVVSPIENKSAARGKLPDDITTMVVSSINSIGSDKIVLADMDYLDPAKVEGDLFFVKGAITEYDTIKKQSKGFNFGVRATKGGQGADADGSAGSNMAISKITIDFNMLDYRTNRYVPGVQTKNSMKITDLTNSTDVGFSIIGSGFGINGSITDTDGVHSVIRLLVELSMVELIGKLRTYPYWVCVHNSQIDRDLLSKMQNDFNNFDKDTKTIYIQHLLSIIDSDVSVDSTKMAITNKKIIAFKKRHSIIPYNTDITTELYIKLLTEIPKILTQKGWDTNMKKVFSKVLNY